MKQADEYEARALDALKQAVAEALERKRRLGQYAVVWREGRPICVGSDAPTTLSRHGIEPEAQPGRVAEPSRDDPPSH